MCRRLRAKEDNKGKRLVAPRGGFTTKIHAKSDASGAIIAFDLTGGEAFDGRHFETLLGIGPDIQPRVVICEQRLRQQRQPRGGEGARHCSVDARQGQRKEQAGLLCTGCTVPRLVGHIEQGVGRLKRFKRVALRCEKTTRNFRSIVSFAAGLCLIKFVHTA